MAEQRLPIVNSDDGTWGDILRQYLLKEHYNGDADLVQATSENGGHKTVTIQPGTTAAGTAPLKFMSGSPMTTPEVGAMEFQTDTLYFTQTTSTTRKKIAMYDDTGGATGDIYYRNSSGYFTRLGIGSTNNVLTVVGGVPTWQAASAGMSRSLTVTSGNYSVGSAASTDYIYIISGSHSGTLPAASSNTNRYTFKNNHSANVTLTRAGSDTIEGSTSITLSPGSSIDLISNGTNAWFII